MINNMEITIDNISQDNLSLDLNISTHELPIEITFAEGIQGQKGDKGDSGESLTFQDDTKTEVTVGGLMSGSDIGGLNTLEVLDKILNPELFQTSVTNPSASMTIEGYQELMPVGATLEIIPAYQFNPGMIYPKYETSSADRSIGLSAYIKTGASHTGNHTIVLGANVWTVVAQYLGGPRPLGSRSTPNPDYQALPNGSTNPFSLTITGVHPVYANKDSIASDSQVLVRPATAIEIIYSVAETDSYVHHIRIPVSWGTARNVYQFADNANAWRRLLDNVFINTSTTEVIGGVQYKTYTNSGVKVGARKLKFTI